jgi:ferredoxin-type protein NapH
MVRRGAPRHIRGMTTRQKIRRAAIIVAFALFPVTLYYFSPVLSLQAMSIGLVSGSLVVFGGLFVVSLFFGRVFCGWACPGAGLQEIVALVRGTPGKRTRINWIKWLVWGPWAGTLLFLALRAGGVRAIDLTFMTHRGMSVTDLPGVIALAMVLLVFLVPAFAVGRRAACHTICWMAPFMILGRKVRNTLGWPALRLALGDNPCRRCGSCTRACPMSIEVEALVQKGKMECADCILCGSCVDSCPGKVIGFSLSSPRGRGLVRMK